MSGDSIPKKEMKRRFPVIEMSLPLINDSYQHISLTPNHILQLHSILYSHDERCSYGGKYKDVQNYITAFGGKGWSSRVFQRSKPQWRWKLCDEFNRVIERKEIDSLILIPIFICGFPCMRPFNDGNGRMSRSLTILLLHRSGYHVGKYISLKAKIPCSRICITTLCNNPKGNGMKGKTTRHRSLNTRHHRYGLSGLRGQGRTELQENIGL